MNEVVVGATYRHFKGGVYFVNCIARDSSNPETRLVVYQSVSDHGWWTREINEFMETLPDGRPRFERVS